MIRNKLVYKYETLLKGVYEMFQTWTYGTLSLQRGAVMTWINNCYKCRVNSSSMGNKHMYTHVRKNIRPYIYTYISTYIYSLGQKDFL